MASSCRYIGVCEWRRQTPALRGVCTDALLQEQRARLVAGERRFQAAIMRASGCPCWEMRAAPFTFLLTACVLALAVRLRFGALAPCYGHGPDHRCSQSYCRCSKLEQLNNQVHEQITSFLRRRHCQDTGLIPLTSLNYTSEYRTDVLVIPHMNESSWIGKVA